MRNKLPRSGLMSSLFAAGVCLGAATVSMSAAAIAFDVQIYDRTENRYLPTYEFQGRTYVVGRPGNEYSIMLRNSSGERVLAVSSVDGVNIVSGETASPSQTGYVMSPWRTAEIKGWRKSLTQTAAFYFTEHDNSYAARTGRPSDVGVIGVALFREQRPPAPPPPIAPYDPRSERDDGRFQAQPKPGAAAEPADALRSAPSAPSASAVQPHGGLLNKQDMDIGMAKEKSLGTGHGRQEYSQTRHTDFRRATLQPERVITIYYDTYSNLLAMGVPVWRKDPYNDADPNPQPRPFPRDPSYGFVPDPR